MTELVSIAVVGAGNRGQTYADQAAVDGRARVVAVVDPIVPAVRSWLIGTLFPPLGGSTAGRRLIGGPRIADMVVVATQDRFSTNRPSRC